MPPISTIANRVKHDHTPDQGTVNTPAIHTFHHAHAITACTAPTHPAQGPVTMDTNLVSPRKAMAMGSKPSGASGVGSFPGSGGTTHVAPEYGTKAENADGSRGIAPSTGRQYAPDHGPVSDHFNRGGKA